MEVHGLEICLDHGIEGFKRYLAWAVVARNVHRIGAMLWQQDVAQEQRLTADRQFASSCFPPRLAATQLLSATGPWLTLTRTSTVLT